MFFVVRVVVDNIVVVVFIFFSCSYWVKLRLIKVQQTSPDATVVVVVIVAVLLLFLLMSLCSQ